jgi:hypothetical protein
MESILQFIIMNGIDAQDCSWNVLQGCKANKYHMHGERKCVLIELGGAGNGFAPPSRICSVVEFGGRWCMWRGVRQQKRGRIAFQHPLDPFATIEVADSSNHRLCLLR